MLGMHTRSHVHLSPFPADDKARAGKSVKNSCEMQLHNDVRHVLEVCDVYCTLNGVMVTRDEVPAQAITSAWYHPDHKEFTQKTPKVSSLRDDMWQLLA